MGINEIEKNDCCDLLRSCIDSMCYVENFEELERLLFFIIRYANCLYDLNQKRICLEQVEAAIENDKNVNELKEG